MTREETEYVLELQRALFRLIELAREHGFNGTQDVNEAEELIRCSRLGCGLGGACNGKGDDQYSCPLQITPRPARSS